MDVKNSTPYVKKSSASLIEGTSITVSTDVQVTHGIPLSSRRASSPIDTKVLPKVLTKAEIEKKLGISKRLLEMQVQKAENGSQEDEKRLLEFLLKRDTEGYNVLGRVALQAKDELFYRQIERWIKHYSQKLQDREDYLPTYYKESSVRLDCFYYVVFDDKFDVEEIGKVLKPSLLFLDCDGIVYCLESLQKRKVKLRQLNKLPFFIEDVAITCVIEQGVIFSDWLLEQLLGFNMLESNVAFLVKDIIQTRFNRQKSIQSLLRICEAYKIELNEETIELISQSGCIENFELLQESQFLMGDSFFVSEVAGAYSIQKCEAGIKGISQTVQPGRIEELCDSFLQGPQKNQELPRKNELSIEEIARVDSVFQSLQEDSTSTTELVQEEDNSTDSLDGAPFADELVVPKKEKSVAKRGSKNRLAQVIQGAKTVLNVVRKGSKGNRDFTRKAATSILKRQSKPVIGGAKKPMIEDGLHRPLFESLEELAKEAVDKNLIKALTSGQKKILKEIDVALKGSARNLKLTRTQVGSVVAWATEGVLDKDQGKGGHIKVSHKGGMWLAPKYHKQEIIGPEYLKQAVDAIEHALLLKLFEANL